METYVKNGGDIMSIESGNIIKGFGMSNPGQDRFADVVGGLAADIYGFVIDSTRIEPSLNYLLKVADNYSKLVRKAKYNFVLYTKTDLVDLNFDDMRETVVSKLAERYGLEGRLTPNDVVLSGFGDVAKEGLEEELDEILTTYYSEDDAEKMRKNITNGKVAKKDLEYIKSIVSEEDVSEEVSDIVKDYVEEYYSLKQFLFSKSKELRDRGDIKDHLRVFLVGIGSAGKTTALYKLRENNNKNKDEKITITITHDLVDFDIDLSAI